MAAARHSGEEAARNIPAIRLKCPEDFDALARRLEALPRNSNERGLKWCRSFP